MSDVNQSDVLRIGAIMELNGAFEVANVYHVVAENEGGRTFAEASLEIQEYMDDIYAALAATLSDEVLPVNLTLQNVTQATTFGAFAWDAFAGGTQAADQTAPGVALFAWARTLKPRVQIRKYFGVFTEQDMTGGEWSAGVRTACINALTLHVQEYVATGGMIFTGVAYNRTLATTTEGLSVATSAEPAYQRRRKRGRGS